MPDDLEEKTLISRASAGDMPALNAIVGMHYERIVGIVSYYVDSYDDILDVVQDTFLDVLRHKGSLDRIDDFPAWIRTVCRNRIRMFYRTRSRRDSRLTLVDAAVAETLSARASDGRDGDDDSFNVRLLKDCVNQLRPDARELIQLRYFHGMTIKAIAEKLRKKANTLTKAIGRIQDALHACMKSRAIESEA